MIIVWVLAAVGGLSFIISIRRSWCTADGPTNSFYLYHHLSVR